MMNYIISRAIFVFKLASIIISLSSKFILSRPVFAPPCFWVSSFSITCISASMRTETIHMPKLSLKPFPTLTTNVLGSIVTSAAHIRTLRGTKSLLSTRENSSGKFCFAYWTNHIYMAYCLSFFCKSAALGRTKFLFARSMSKELFMAKLTYLNDIFSGLFIGAFTRTKTIIMSVLSYKDNFTSFTNIFFWKMYSFLSHVLCILVSGNNLGANRQRNGTCRQWIGLPKPQVIIT